MIWNTRKYKDGLYKLDKNGNISYKKLQEGELYPVHNVDAVKFSTDNTGILALICNCPYDGHLETVVKGKLAWITKR